jgi:serine/threonine-protein kinase
VESRIVIPFGRYVLKERLAQGGMGEIFRAVAVGEHGFEKPVVVKRVLPTHAGREDLTELFVAEAKLMTRLAHPNIVEVLDFGRGEHRDYYLVLELVDGTDLGRLMRAVRARGEPFSIPLALFIASQVLRGLHHAHTKSAGEGGVIVHRDVSPSNVLCSTEGEVKVADFGVALVTQAGKGASAGVAGKPGYMPPEQFDGGAVDPRADVFSAAVVLHQMLTGDLPFPGETPEAQQEATRRGERLEARARRPDLSESIEAILARALAPSPEARFPDARAMAQAIEALRDQGQRIATGDDVAEAVRAAQQELPAPGRRVIALTGQDGHPHSQEDAPEAAPEPEDSPRELTRTGAPGGVGAFTLRFPVRADATTRQRTGAESLTRPDRFAPPEPRTERIDPSERRVFDGGAPHTPAQGRHDGGDTALGCHDGGDTDTPALDGGTPEPSVGTSSLVGSALAGHARPDEAAAPSGQADGPRQRTLRRGVITVVVAAALLGVAAFFTRAPRTVAPPGSSAPIAEAPASAPIAEAPASAPIAGETAPAAVASPPLSATPAPRPLGRLPTARPPASAVSLAASIPAGSAGPAARASLDDDCKGRVHFSTEGSWDVSGGPSYAQTPGYATWRCGDYAVTLRSRADHRVTRSSTVHVRQGTTAEVDLR